MFRTVVIPKSTDINISIPAFLVGKEVEITAEEIKHHKNKTHITKRRLELENFFYRYSFDVSKLKLSRDEANER